MEAQEVAGKDESGTSLAGQAVARIIKIFQWETHCKEMSPEEGIRLDWRSKNLLWRNSLHG